MVRFKHLLPHGFIGGSEDQRFHISSRGARLLIYWGCLLVLIGLVWCGIWIARNAESCDYQSTESESGCRISKDSFGNYQIGNIVLVAVTVVMLVGFFYLSLRMAGSMTRFAQIAENRNYSLFLVMSTLIVFALSVSNWLFGWVFLYEKEDNSGRQRNSACTANREGVGILEWILLVLSLVLLVTMILGVSGYGGAKSVAMPVPSDGLEQSGGTAIV